MGINDKIPVNDGGGLWDNAGLCETLVNDCNNAVKLLTSGQYLAFCGVMYQAACKLANLKKGIREEMDSKNKIIEELKQINKSLLEQLNGSKVADNGTSDGAEQRQ